MANCKNLENKGNIVSYLDLYTQALAQAASIKLHYGEVSFEYIDAVSEVDFYRDMLEHSTNN